VKTIRKSQEFRDGLTECSYVLEALTFLTGQKIVIVFIYKIMNIGLSITLIWLLGNMGAKRDVLF
jgi:hypothetical protein